jgi:toxin YoeB
MAEGESAYEIRYAEQFFEDIQAHKRAGQKSIFKKVNTLIDELREHPYTGTGKPEPLIGNRKGYWSRRITQKHRLIYSVNNEIVVVFLVAAFGHYDDK